MRKTGGRRKKYKQKSHTRRRMKGGGYKLYSYKDKIDEIDTYVPLYTSSADTAFGFGIKPIESIFRAYKPDASGNFDPYKTLDNIKFHKWWQIGL